MGNGYNQSSRHHQNVHLQHKSTFLPILCSRPSIKDASFPRWENGSVSFSNDPLSPKIGCMGQVKRSNRIVGFPSSSSSKLDISTPNDSAATSVKYSKLKRIFSGRNFTTTTTSSSSTSIANTTNRRRREVTFDSKARRPNKYSSQENPVDSISIEEMDPPLPVIKKVQKSADGGEVNSLWKRRCGGVSLTNLQLQQIQVNNRHGLAPTTV